MIMNINNKKKMKKTPIIIIIILAIFLILTITYIFINEYRESKEKGQIDIFQQGAQYGFEFAINQIINQVVTCQQVPLIFENQTINIIAVDCLQQG